METNNSFSFAEDTYVNKFDIADRYNNCEAKGDFIGFFKWLATVVSVNIVSIVKKLVDNLAQGHTDAIVSAAKGLFAKDKSNLPDPAENEYPNKYPEAFQQEKDMVFKAIGMGDGKGGIDSRYFDPEYILRANCIDSLIDKYIEEHGENGEILNKKGKSITKRVRTEAHQSVELGEGDYSLKYTIQGEKKHICLLEEAQVKQVEALTGEKDFAKKSSQKLGSYFIFDMNNEDIKNIIINCKLQHREEPKPEIEEQKEEKTEIAGESKEAEKTEENDKSAVQTEEKDHPEKDDGATKDNVVENDKTMLGYKHYPERKGGELKMIMRTPIGKKEFEKQWKQDTKDKKIGDWDYLRENNGIFRNEVANAAKDKKPEDVFIQISIDSSLIDVKKGLVKVPISNHMYPDGTKNPTDKFPCYIRIPDDLNIGDGAKRKEEHSYTEKNKDGKIIKEGKSFVFTLRLDENFQLLTNKGNQITVDNKPLVASALDLLNNFTLQGYCVEPKKTTGMPEAYIVNNTLVKGNEKAVVFHEQTTKISKDTFVDNPDLTELDFNHAKVTVRPGAFKNLSSEIKIKNAENVSFESGAFVNTNRLIFVEPEIISDNKADILADLQAKATALGASYEAVSAPEPVIEMEQAENAVEAHISEEEQAKREECERAEQEILQRNEELRQKEEMQNEAEQEKEVQPGKQALDIAYSVGNIIATAELVNGIVQYHMFNPTSMSKPITGTATDVEDLKQKLDIVASQTEAEVKEMPYKEAVGMINRVYSMNTVNPSQGQER